MKPEAPVRQAVVTSSVSLTTRVLRCTLVCGTCIYHSSHVALRPYQPPRPSAPPSLSPSTATARQPCTTKIPRKLVVEYGL